MVSSFQCETNRGGGGGGGHNDVKFDNFFRLGMS